MNNALTPYGWRTIVSLWDLGVRNEVLSTISNMNAKATVKVNSPVGSTNTFNVTAIVKQGTLLGSILCSTSTAECVTHLDGGVQRGTSIKSMVFADDVANVNTTPGDIIQSHNKMMWFTHKK